MPQQPPADPNPSVFVLVSDGTTWSAFAHRDGDHLIEAEITGPVPDIAWDRGHVLRGDPSPLQIALEFTLQRLARLSQ